MSLSSTSIIQAKSSSTNRCYVVSLSLSRTLLFHAERWRDKEEKKNESNGVDLTSQLKSNINATE